MLIILLKDPETSLDAVLTLCNVFRLYLGIRVNWNKTNFLAFDVAANTLPVPDPLQRV